MALLESVPNVSEGRDPAVDRVRSGRPSRPRARARRPFGRRPPSLRLHDRRGGPSRWSTRCSTGSRRAAELIDLRAHDGIHPRIGAADVVPIVPLRAGEMELARRGGARRSGVGSAPSSDCPCSSTATSAEGRRPAFFRRGGPAELQRRIDAGEVRPAFGPLAARPAGRRRPHRSASAPDRVQHRARDRRPRRRAGDRGRRSANRAAACPACRRSACCCRERARPGVAQRDRRRGRAARRRRRARAGSSRQRAASRSGASELVGLLPESAAVAPAAASGSTSCRTAGARAPTLTPVDTPPRRR